MSVIEKFNRVTAKKNIPVSIMFELTKKCNLRCIHCYINPVENQSTKVEYKTELSTSEIFNILGQLADSGSLYILFTGGEVFLRGDFFDILNYANKKHFAITIFTNGVFITNEVAKKLSRYNLVNVGISLYSMNQLIHDKITGVSGSWRRTVSAIKSLREQNIPVEIKTPLMKQNFYGYQKIIKFADTVGAKYGFDISLVPCDNGDRTPLKYRIDEKQLRSFFNHQGVFKPLENNNLNCTAGKNVCAINCYGDVYPCLQFLVKFGNLREKLFSEIWRKNFVRKDYLLKLTDLTLCRSCNLINYCGRCPGIALLEDGDIRGPWSRACEIANVSRDFNLAKCSD